MTRYGPEQQSIATLCDKIRIDIADAEAYIAAKRRVLANAEATLATLAQQDGTGLPIPDLPAPDSNVRYIHGPAAADRRFKYDRAAIGAATARFAGQHDTFTLADLVAALVADGLLPWRPEQRVAVRQYVRSEVLKQPQYVRKQHGAVWLWWRADVAAAV